MRWEARTMRSGTFCCNAAMAKKTFFRFWPLWALYAVIWLIVLPLQGLMILQMDSSVQTIDGIAGSYMSGFSKYSVPQVTGFSLFLAVVFGLLAAMAVCSHLYSTRSANFMGALPTRREGMFLSQYLSGLAMLILPNLLIFVLTLLVELAGGAVYPAQLAFWLAHVCAADFFFYSFAVFLGMFAGHLLALPVFYGIGNMLVLALYWMLQWVMQSFYYGFAGFGSTVDEAVVWLTPVRSLRRVDFDADAAQVEDGHVLAVCAVVALILAAAALLLYRRRHLETAGDVVAVRAMRPVFKYGVAVCSGLFFGFVTNTILGAGEVGLMVCIVLWGAAGYFAAQMLLDKSFRVFRKWKGAAVVAAAFILLFVVVALDLTGFETRVPAADEVAQVSITGPRSYPYDSASYNSADVDDPDTIARIIALHQAAVDHREDFNGAAYGDVTLTYTLKNGSTFSRSYGFAYDLADQNHEGTIAWALGQLLSDRDLVWALYGFDQAVESGGTLKSAIVYDEYGNYDSTVYYGADARALLDAVTRDFEAGNIGVRSLSYKEDIDGAPTLQFSYSQSLNTEFSCSIDIYVPDTARETLRALDDLSGQDGLE